MLIVKNLYKLEACDQFHILKQNESQKEIPFEWKLDQLESPRDKYDLHEQHYI